MAFDIFAAMQLNTVIFDMDGLLIDSEPLWYEAANEILARFEVSLSTKLYETTTGLRTLEFTEWWFRHFKLDPKAIEITANDINLLVIEKIKAKGKPLPGVAHVFNYFISRQYKIGVASSSDTRIIDVVIDKLGVRNYLQTIQSAEHLAYGKPHPQVYLNTAEALNSNPAECICFEDSFNGMIAAKAAKMKCVIVPAHHDRNNAKFGAADLKLSSLQNFNELLLHSVCS